MQSTMDSWQFEKFSTAEISPPISPAPASPTLYSYNHVNGAPLSPASSSTCFDNDITSVQAHKSMLQHEQDPHLQQAVSIQSRAQLATSILKDLEKLGDMHFKSQNDFGDNWLEESVNLENLELFEELSEFAYTPSSTPEPFSTNHQSVQSSFAPAPSPSQLSEISTFHSGVNEQQPHAKTSAYDQLTREFEAILESLPTGAASEGDIVDILGFQATLVGDEEMIPYSLVEQAISGTLNDVDLGMEMEVSSSNEDDHSAIVVDEQEMYLLNDENSVDISSPYHSSITSSPVAPVSEDEDDVEANTAEKILDALLLGNLRQAESYIPVTIVKQTTLAMPIEDSSSCDYDSDVNVVTPSPPMRKRKSVSEPTVAEKKTKYERRGRKPSSNRKPGTDKALRKKEQNKTAATRYRQKKKMETVSTLEQENQLQNEHDDLSKEKEDLNRQILMVKQLLREVVQSKKRQAAKRIVSTNRRKL